MAKFLKKLKKGARGAYKVGRKATKFVSKARKGKYGGVVSGMVGAADQAIRSTPQGMAALGAVKKVRQAHRGIKRGMKGKNKKIDKDYGGLKYAHGGSNGKGGLKSTNGNGNGNGAGAGARRNGNGNGNGGLKNGNGAGAGAGVRRNGNGNGNGGLKKL